jgi:hypothetical protein
MPLFIAPARVCVANLYNHFRREVSLFKSTEAVIGAKFHYTSAPVSPFRLLNSQRDVVVFLRGLASCFPCSIASARHSAPASPTLGLDDTDRFANQRRADKDQLARRNPSDKLRAFVHLTGRSTASADPSRRQFRPVIHLAGLFCYLSMRSAHTPRLSPQAGAGRLHSNQPRARA